MIRVQSEYQEGSKTIPNKVIRHFPLIPRLKCLYGSLAIVKLLRWHSEQVVEVGEIDRARMEFVVESPAWRHIDNIDPSFTQDCRNVRM